MIKLEFDNKKLQIDFEDLQKIIKVVGNKQDNIPNNKPNMYLDYEHRCNIGNQEE